MAVGLSANIWRFVWGPVADLTLSLRTWYWIGLTTCAGTLCLLSLMPIRQDRIGLLTAMVFVSQVAATLVVLPVGGLMAHTVAEGEKGRASDRKPNDALLFDLLSEWAPGEATRRRILVENPAALYGFAAHR